ncbi:zeta toxin family protein (plasmid) [Rhizobium sp. T1470]|uniref:zeta toxin family protein n=1 Tax=unclassified Rhizobium TaxID=2613769 RepID=UPI001AAEE17C|nr:zeta toxin family protein [Rhizobium sp. T1473]MCA0806049.1 zeta toxin family protein [Rhizobium sp. T1473]
MPELSCILLAGPNGSGKSSAFAKLDLEGVWINADEIAKAIPSGHDGRSTDMQAGRAALLKIAKMIETRQSFIFETTLSSLQSIRLMQEAKAAGFTVGLLIDNSGLEPHEVFAISSGVVHSFDIDDSQELHVQMAAKVCEAYDLVRVQEGFRSTEEVNKEPEEHSSLILRSVSGFNSKPAGMK